MHIDHPVHWHSLIRAIADSKRPTLFLADSKTHVLGSDLIIAYLLLLAYAQTDWNLRCAMCTSFTYLTLLHCDSFMVSY